MYSITARNARAVYALTFKPPPPPPRIVHTREDWERMRVEAFETGKLPQLPDLLHKGHRQMIQKVLETARQGDLKALKKIHIKDYNSSIRLVGKFRDLCVIALMTQQRLAEPEAD